MVVVCSAGNTKDPEPASDDSNPRRNAKPGRQGETSLIVVGGTNENGFIWAEPGNGPGTNIFRNIISAWAPGARMDVATRPTADDPALYGTDWGTSLSAGIVTGLVATFLDRPDLAARFRPGSVASDMKSFLRFVVGPYHTDVKTDNENRNAENRVGTFNYVPCPGQNNNGLTRRAGTPIRRPPGAADTNGVSSRSYICSYSCQGHDD